MMIYLQAIAGEIARSSALERIQSGLDYFDASIHRVAAWAIGARNRLLEPFFLKALEAKSDISQH